MIVKKLDWQNVTYEIYLNEQDEGLFDSHVGKWMVRKKRNKTYLETYTWKPNGKFGGIGFHRLVLGVSDPKSVIDHINGNGLDNRRENLRICTVSQNAMNRTRQRNNKTGFKGVSYDRVRKKFKACIHLDGKTKHLGMFLDSKEAALAYDSAAVQFFGKFAVLNFPDVVRSPKSNP